MNRFSKSAMATAMAAPLHTALVGRTPDCGPLRLGTGQMTKWGLDPRWLLSEVHRLHRHALRQASAESDRRPAASVSPIVRFVIDGRLDHFRCDCIAIFERIELPSAATCWSSMTRLVAEGRAAVEVALVSIAALPCGHSAGLSVGAASEVGEPSCHMHRILDAFDLDAAGRPGVAFLVDVFARAESIMLADALGITTRREIEIRGLASGGETIEISTRIRRANDAGRDAWKLVGIARRRSDGHLLATCETSLDVLPATHHEGRFDQPTG